MRALCYFCKHVQDPTVNCGVLRPDGRGPGGDLPVDRRRAAMSWSAVRTVAVLELRQRVRSTRWQFQFSGACVVLEREGICCEKVPVCAVGAGAGVGRCGGGVGGVEVRARSVLRNSLVL